MTTALRQSFGRVTRLILGDQLTTALRQSFGRVTRLIIGDQWFGAIEYAMYPDRGVAWGGAFNGQPFRQALFRALIRRLEPAAIVETGTYLGTTTEFMAETGLPIFTVEAHQRSYGFARARLRRQRNVTLLHGDSRAALRTLFDGPLRAFVGRTLFFYLDAHGNDDLPLAEELDIVFTRCPEAVVMVDDFRVPGDADYGYDDYGSEKALTDTYISSAVVKLGLCTHYPSTPGRFEGGQRRGCVVLSNAFRHIAELSSIPLLRTASSGIAG
jgi:predicted O-methyltransferase YrrM